MRQSTFIAIIIPLLMLAMAMTFRYYTNDNIAQMPQTTSVGSLEVKLMIHESITKLKELGIDATSVEEKITDNLASFPSEVYEAMNREQINGMLLSNIAWLLYDNDSAAPVSEPRQFFTFDVECMDPDNMYTIFLNSLSGIAGEDLMITDIKEDTSKVDYESGTGVQTISFNCNGKAYQYDAASYHDWFDVGMLTFMNDVISEQNNGKHLYVTSDGYQECIVFYQTEFWAARFKKTMGFALEQP